jgi:hypothetical protein
MTKVLLLKGTDGAGTPFTIGGTVDIALQGDVYGTGFSGSSIQTHLNSTINNSNGNFIFNLGPMSLSTGSIDYMVNHIFTPLSTLGYSFKERVVVGSSSLGIKFGFGANSPLGFDFEKNEISLLSITSSGVEIKSGNSLKFYNSANTFCVGFKVGSPSSNVIWTLPNTDSANFLKSDGIGNLSFSSAVTSVGITGSTGISVSGSPITSSGTIALSLSSVPISVLSGYPGVSSTFLRGDGAWATPYAGVTSVTGTTNQITVTGTTTPVISLPSAVTISGALTAGSIVSTSSANSTFAGSITLASTKSLTADYLIANTYSYAPQFLHPTGSIGSPILGGNAAIIIASGTTAQRPTGVAGMLRYNTSTSGVEYYSSAWNAITAGGVTSVTGTTNQITVTGTTTPVISLPSAVYLPGSLNTTTFINVGTDALVGGKLWCSTFVTNGSVFPDLFNFASNNVSCMRLPSYGVVSAGLNYLIGDIYNVSNVGLRVCTTAGTNITSVWAPLAISSSSFSPTFGTVSANSITVSNIATFNSYGLFNGPGILCDKISSTILNGVITFIGGNLTSAIRLPTQGPSSGIAYSLGDLYNSSGSIKVCTTAGTGTASAWSSLATTASTWDVAHGGTGQISMVPYGIVCGSTTSTAAYDGIAPVASGSVLISNGTSAFPSWSGSPTVDRVQITNTLYSSEFMPSPNRPTSTFNFYGYVFRLPANGPVSYESYSLGDLYNSSGNIKVCTTAGTGATALWSHVAIGKNTNSYNFNGITAYTLSAVTTLQAGTNLDYPGLLKIWSAPLSGSSSDRYLSIFGDSYSTNAAIYNFRSYGSTGTSICSFNAFVSGTAYYTIGSSGYSVAGTYRMIASGYDTSSSKKIKNIVHNDKKLYTDAEHLFKSIPFFRYTNIDKKRHGHGEYFGVVAEHLSEVAPHYVNDLDDHIPNILATAVISNDSQYQILKVESESLSQDLAGENLLVKDSNGNHNETKIIKVNDNSLTIEKVKGLDEGDEVFVYGTKESCPVVDKSRVFELGMVVLQDALRRIEALEAAVELYGKLVLP